MTWNYGLSALGTLPIASLGIVEQAMIRRAFRIFAVIFVALAVAAAGLSQFWANTIIHGKVMFLTYPDGFELNVDSMGYASVVNWFLPNTPDPTHERHLFPTFGTLADRFALYMYFPWWLTVFSATALALAVFLRTRRKRKGNAFPVEPG